MDKRLLAILVIALLLRVGSVYITPIKWWDEAVYADLGWKLSQNPVDYSFGPFWDLSFGCNECAGYRAPLLPYMLAGIYAVFGDNMLALEMLLPLVGVLGVFGAYLLARELFGEEAAVISALFLALMPLHAFFSGRILTDVLAATAITFSVLFFWKGFVKGEKGLPILCGIMAAASILARYMSALLLPVFFLALLLKHRNLSFLDKRAAVAGVAFLLVLSPWLMYSQHVYGNPLGAFLHGSEAAFYWEGGDTLMTFLGFGLAYCSAAAIAAGADVLGLLGKKKWPGLQHLFLLLWAGAFILFVLALPHKEFRFLVPAAPAIAILGAHWAQGSRKRVFAVALVLVVSAALVFYGHAAVSYDREHACFLEAAEFLQGTEADAVVFSDYSPLVFFYSHRETAPLHSLEWHRGVSPEYILLSEFDRAEKEGLGELEMEGTELVFACPEGEPLAGVYRAK